MEFPTLHQKIIEFLQSLPNIHDSESQRALIVQASLDKELQAQIQFGKPPSQFVPLLVSTLLQYGKLADGRDALGAVLTSTKNFVGQDRKAACDVILQELRKYPHKYPLSLPSESNQQSQLIYLAKTWGLIITICLLAIVTSLYEISQFNIWRKIRLIIQNQSWTLLITIFFFYGIAFFSMCLFNKIWRLRFFKRLCLYRKKWPLKFYLKIFISGLLPLISTFFFLILFVEPGGDKKAIEVIFPEAYKFGPAVLSTYATNGKVEYSIHKETLSYGPEKGYAKVTFQSYGNTIEQNCGLIILLLHGIDLTPYKKIRFWIKGAHGDIKIGIKAKDIRGTEFSIMLGEESMKEEPYLREGKITPSWQEVNIPLNHFGNVDFNLIENFSFFSNGLIAQGRYQTLYIGGIELIR